LQLGQRICILPTLTAQTHQLELLKFLPLEEPAVYRELFLVTRRLRSISSTAQALLFALLTTLQEKALPLGVKLSERTE
jgi:DNA-binding transcriptional LysR family regulator